ncbi:CAP domain-containing protein [Syncephalis pseudoplumigaleata]|uniref:CAP domain-containing protein n=1 Tax=Syncephalis pseudoplumigaleata TaxID=1712513 RepID=A0A4P9Z424_9FUNG|nr:CAP domain-containing protein [Syncephalis pseudoplumigaleata]|eukprot:RKP27158.1 CAP domain-containing protein [Syncephalis pseudoplumigaleata]
MRSGPDFTRASHEYEHGMCRVTMQSPSPAVRMQTTVIIVIIAAAMPLPRFLSPTGGSHAKPPVKQQMQQHGDWLRTTIAGGMPSPLAIAMVLLVHGAIIALLIGGLESVFTVSDSGATVNHPLSRSLLCKVNMERMRMRLPALGMDATLIRSAQVHSDAQARARAMSHQLPGEPTPMQRIDAQNDGGRTWVKYGENVAYGYTAVDVVMEKWMKSPGHRANILGNFTHFGAAIAYSTDKTPYWTQNFANNGKVASFPLCPELDESAPSTSSSGSSKKADDHAGTASKPSTPAPPPITIAATGKEQQASSAESDADGGSGSKASQAKPPVNQASPRQAGSATAHKPESKEHLPPTNAAHRNATSA